MRTLSLSLAFGALAITGTLIAGCSSKQGTSNSGGGLSGTPQNQNTDGGVFYPTTGIGTAQRGLDGTQKPGTVRGSVIANYKFLGYPENDASKVLQTIALSDYYDPTGSKKTKVLHIVASSGWCPDCISETAALLAALANPATDYRTQGVVYLQTVDEGITINVGATQPDLDAWIARNHTHFASVLDPEAQSLGAFFDAAAVPFNADIDVRTMEVLKAGTGLEDPKAVQVWIDWVKSNPPSYPLPTSP